MEGIEGATARGSREPAPSVLVIVDCAESKAATRVARIDVPAIATVRAKLPARDFVRELEGAFDTRLVELGWWH